MHRSLVTAVALVVLAVVAATPSPQRARHGSEDHKVPMDMAIRIPNVFNMILRRNQAGLGVGVGVPALLTFQLNSNRPFPGAMIPHSPGTAIIYPSLPQRPLTTTADDVQMPQ